VDIITRLETARDQTLKCFALSDDQLARSYGPDAWPIRFILHLVGAYNGQKDLARQLAEKGLALLDSHAVPASSWSDTEERRGEVRSGLQDVLKKLDAAH
jgi:DinB superfamily